MTNLVASSYIFQSEFYKVSKGPIYRFIGRSFEEASEKFEFKSLWKIVHVVY